MEKTKSPKKARMELLQRAVTRLRRQMLLSLQNQGQVFCRTSEKVKQINFMQAYYNRVKGMMIWCCFHLSIDTMGVLV
jgi:hypothetical protein